MHWFRRQSNAGFNAQWEWLLRSSPSPNKIKTTSWTGGLHPPFKGVIRTQRLKAHRKVWQPHWFHRQPLKAAVCFCLIILATRKRVNILFESQLIVRYVLLQLISYVFFNRFFVLPHCIYIVSSAPEMPVAIFVLQIGVPVEDHQRALPFQIPHKLYYTQIRRYLHKHVYVVGTCFCFDDIYFFLFAQSS